MWDAIFLWSLASAAGNAAQADWFYHHQYDQGYIDWRRQADIEAQQNADLRAQLATIDQHISTLESQKVARDPNYLPRVPIRRWRSRPRMSCRTTPMMPMSM